jgi:hypothetical protein
MAISDPHLKKGRPIVPPCRALCGLGCRSVVESVPTMCKAQGSVPSMAKKKKTHGTVCDTKWEE